MTVRKIGLFGGTFDPIHNGHLNLAFELMEKKELEQVWFIPAQINPFKKQVPPIPIEQRIAMCRLAIQDIPQFHLKDLEKERPPPSYTIHTLQAFIAEEALNPRRNQFYLLMGEDTVPGFFHWHLPEEIVQLVPLLIGSRSGIWQYDLDNFSLTVREAIQKGLIQTRLMDISGTEIRHRLAKRLHCGHLIPIPVLQYIHENQIYTH
jgi:nicotinate-nucleotide adenylyltransferase